MLKFLTGVAALALAAGAVSADPGGGKGGGNGGDKGGGKGHEMQGGSHGGGDHGGKDKSDRGKSADQGSKEQAQSPSRPDRKFDKPGKSDEGGRKSASFDKAPKDRGDFRTDRNRAQSGNGVADRRDRESGENWRWADAVPQRTRGLIAGCPPGLAKKDNGCLPPGLARKAGYAPVFYDSPSWWNFDDRWHDSAAWNGGDYRYYDGYLVRYGDRGIDSWLPLLGGALSPGNLWPSQYETQGLPSYYQDYYGVGQPDGYRYYDDTLYRVDPQSNAITAISALLTGDTFQVGQSLPAGYDVYNVPYSYRDRYPDGGESDYRYSDGSIYQVDTKTQIIQAVIGLLT